MPRGFVRSVATKQYDQPSAATGAGYATTGEFETASRAAVMATLRSDAMVRIRVAVGAGGNGGSREAVEGLGKFTCR